MATVDTETSDIIEIHHDNREYRFSKIDSETVCLNSVVTKYRNSSVVTGQYTSFDDFPSPVTNMLSHHGFVLE